MIRAVLWDVGNVLVHWDVRALYRRVFDDPDEMETFLAEVWTTEHNRRCDGGEPFADVIGEVVAAHPHYEVQVRAARERWIETILGPVDGSAELLSDLRDAGYTQIGVTNFSAETYPEVTRYPHLGLLDDVVVSGAIGVLKPDPRIYERALELAGVEPHEAVFVDDSADNVDGARRLGVHGIVFVDVPRTRAELAALDVRV